MDRLERSEALIQLLLVPAARERRTSQILWRIAKDGEVLAITGTGAGSGSGSGNETHLPRIEQVGKAAAIVVRCIGADVGKHGYAAAFWIPGRRNACFDIACDLHGNGVGLQFAFLGAEARQLPPSVNRAAPLMAEDRHGQGDPNDENRRQGYLGSTPQASMIALARRGEVRAERARKRGIPTAAWR